MPLSKVNGYDTYGLPYDLKLQIVETNCSGCDHFLKYEDEEQIPVIGCVFPNDVLGSQNGFLSLLDIVHNSCIFWNDRFLVEPPKIDSSEGNWNDPNLEGLCQESLTTQLLNSNLYVPSSMSPSPVS